MMKIITTVDARKPPVKTRLVGVMTGTVLRKEAPSVRRTDGMKKRAEIRPGLHRQQGILASRSEHGKGFTGRILLDEEVCRQTLRKLSR